MSKPHVLLVDDEPHILLSIRFLLERAGMLVTQAGNGAEALQLAAKNPPDLAVLDVMMPGMSGFELSKQLRSKERHENLKIVFLTAKGTDRDKMEGYQSGGEIYLTKPFDNDELVRIIQELITFG